jgi:hypothetical protein
MRLLEVISQDTIDKALKKFRDPVQSKLKGDIGKYTFSLETLLDMLADSSTKSDSDFLSMVRQVERHISRITPGVAKSKIKKEPKSKLDLPKIGSIEPKKEPTKELPSLATLASRETGKPPPFSSPVSSPKKSIFEPIKLSQQPGVITPPLPPELRQAQKEREYDMNLRRRDKVMDKALRGK